MGDMSDKPDMVEHPPHYTSHPSGIECIQVTRHMGFSIGNAIKYLWRADEKGNAIEDLQKAKWYIEDEIRKREGGDVVAQLAITEGDINNAIGIEHGGEIDSTWNPE